MRLYRRSHSLRPALVLAAVGLVADTTCQGQEAATQPPTVEQLYQDGNALAGLANLGLTGDQLRKLEGYCRAYQVTVQGQKAKRASILTRARPELERRLQLLLTGKDCPADVLAAIDSAAAALEELDLQAADARAALGKQVSQVLNQAQVRSLTGTNEAAAAAEALTGVRAMSTAAFEQEGQVTAELLVQSAPAEPPLDVEDVLELFREVRTLTEGQYGAQRDAFVTRLLPLFAVSDEDLQEALAERFAYPRMADLLAQRLAHLAPR